jgi:hypothetical protein
LGHLGHPSENLLLSHKEMRRCIVQFEREHLDDKIFRKVVSSTQPVMPKSARDYITVGTPELYFQVRSTRIATTPLS